MSVGAVRLARYRMVDGFLGRRRPESNITYVRDPETNVPAADPEIIKSTVSAHFSQWFTPPELPSSIEDSAWASLYEPIDVNPVVYDTLMAPPTVADLKLAFQRPPTVNPEDPGDPNRTLYSPS